MQVDFASPWMLMWLPLVLLPLLRWRRDTLGFPYVAWLPADRLGPVVSAAWRGVAMLAMLLIVIGLANPQQPAKQVVRVGRGAEFIILLDRSASMDAIVPPAGVRGAGALSEGESKGKAARDVLSRFVARRPHDRFLFMMFGLNPLLAVPFTGDNMAIQAAISGTGIDRGMPDTRIGAGVLAAIDQFDHRAYTGNRVILLVSDGGDHLEAEMRTRIAAGLERTGATLYFVYLRSSANSANLKAIAPSDESSEEVELHRFFLSLKTPYRLYQADNVSETAAAMADIGAQQNFPVSYVERLPARDRSSYCFAAALLCCAFLFGFRFVILRSWL
ncbi:conserved membrane hypothetical protein [Paraburkholderia ribeironis]|uniref:VWFA domain-containing protein n=2 Tax=Paraburkholderia ribeironis TaxID=1247936 RepID=A0A1N7S8M6_9BURK|nr:conserved membrane hypothetical protein [Paraburkholderia ribeironis]